MIHILLRKCLPLHMIILAYIVTLTSAKTALLFGASGAVGSEILRAMIDVPFWEKVIMVGRRFPPKVTDLLSSGKHTGTDVDANVHDEKPEFVQVQLSDLSNVDENKEILEMQADACFIAVGSAAPQEMNLNHWHSVEVEIVASIARLCNQIQVKYVALLSAIDSEQKPKPFSQEELDADPKPLGWWGMIEKYSRIMGLKEMAVTKESKKISFVRIFLPSSIITKETRYGWVDWTLFKLHKIFDPVIPAMYHSIKVELLGAAMVGDAVQFLSSEDKEGNDFEVGEKRLTYEDFLLTIAKADFYQNNRAKQTVQKRNAEL